MLINLLPWRQRARLRARRRFSRGMLVAAGLAAVLGLSVLALTRLGLEGTRRTNARIILDIAALEQRLTVVDALAARDREIRALEQRIDAIDQQRFALPTLLQELTQAMPDDVYITGLERAGVEWSVEGVSASYSSISRWLRAMQDSSRFIEAELNDIRAEDLGEGGVSLLFSLQLEEAGAHDGAGSAEGGPKAEAKAEAKAEEKAEAKGDALASEHGTS